MQPRRIKSVIGGYAIIVVTIVWAMVSIFGNVDFVVTRIKDPGWIGAMFATMLDPTPMQQILITALMLLVGLGFLRWAGPRKTAQPVSPSHTIKLRNWFRSDKSINDEWMPLNEAARELFELTENKMVGQFAAAGNSPDEILDFYGVYITQTPKNILLYGKRPPSTKRQLISADEVRNLHIKDGATVLKDMYDPHHKYTDLEIKRSDFDVLAREITDGTR